MTSTVEIRFAEMRDVRDITTIHASCFPTPWAESEFVRFLQDPLMLCFITATDSPEGFILLRVVEDEAEILTFAVHPERRRMGMARKLLEKAKEVCRSKGVKTLFLEVAEDNLAARSLYRSAAFESQGKRKGYYAREGEVAVDGVTMRLAL